MLGNEFEKQPWADTVMTLTCKTILLKRLASFSDDVMTVTYKVCHGIELMQLQGYDVSNLKAEIPDTSFSTQLAGNAFNGFMFSAFMISTQCGSSVFDDIADPDEVEQEEGGVSSNDEVSSSSTSD